MNAGCQHIPINCTMPGVTPKKLVIEQARVDAYEKLSRMLNGAGKCGRRRHSVVNICNLCVNGYKKSIH